MNKLKKELRKYKHAWPLLYVFFYMPWFITLEQIYPADYEGIHILHSHLDDIIPFCEWFVIPYLLWFLFIPAVFVFLFFHSRNEFYRLCAYEFCGMTIALFICTIYPNGLQLRLDEIINSTNGNILVNIVKYLYSTDTPTNVFPSIHVFATIAAYMCLSKSPHMKAVESRKIIQKLALVLSILIVLSTMFLKQHSIIDVIGGIIEAIVLYFIVFKWWFKNVKFKGPKIKDPKQHQVLFFLNKKNK